MTSFSVVPAFMRAIRMWHTAGVQDFRHRLAPGRQIPMGEYYFDGDPALDGTRRHLERVLNEPHRRRWPWFVAVFAGGAAFTFWRRRSRAGQPPSDGSSATAARTPRALTASYDSRR